MWMSFVLMNYIICLDGFSEVGGGLRDLILIRFMSVMILIVNFVLLVGFISSFGVVSLDNVDSYNCCLF